MQLYLIRHGQAEAGSADGSDASRALTPDGAREMRRVARRLVELGVRFDHLSASPLVRARQTAEALVAEGAAAARDEEEFLSGGGTLDEVRAWVGRRRRAGDRAVALVGHQPSLGEWAEALVCGDAIGRIQLKKGGIAALELPESGARPGACRLLWLASPKLLL